jgi:hypothetical protein
MVECCLCCCSWCLCSVERSIQLRRYSERLLGSPHMGKHLKSTAVPAICHGGTTGERTYSSYSFLTSTLDGGEWSASRPGRALLWGKDPGTHWTGGWLGSRACLDTETRRKILCLCLGLKLGRPVRSQTLYWLSYPCSIDISRHFFKCLLFHNIT